MTAEIIGVDHGFKNMKTAHYMFSSAISPLKSKPDDLDGVLGYENKYYSVYGTPIESVNNHDKVTTPEFYLLTLVSIAKELKKRNIHSKEVKIRIAAGLPPKWYLQQKKNFKSYLNKEHFIKFMFEGDNYKIELENVNVYMQGYSAALTLIPKYKNTYFVIVDIGGETIDIIPVQNQKPIADEIKIDTHASIWLINNIKEAFESEFMEPIHESIILDYMCRDELTPKNKYEVFFKQHMEQYSQMVLTTLKKFKINPDLVPIVFVGGGALILNKFCRLSGANIDYILDISANAKGYEAIDRIIASSK